MAVDHPIPFSVRLDQTGDGTGENDAIGDYSSVDGEFFVQAQGGETIEIHRLIVFIEDTGNPAAGVYGSGSALTDGITFEIRHDDDEVIGVLPFDVKTNADWAAIAYDMQEHTFGTGNNFVSVRWTFSRFGSPIYLKRNEKFVVVLRDNMSFLVHHYFTVQGIYPNRELG